MAKAPRTCWKRCRASAFYWPIAATTATRSEQKIAARGATANIRPLDHRIDPPAFSPRAYKCRNRVEGFFNKIKHYRAVATRFDKHDTNFLAGVKLAAVRIWMRFNEPVT